MMMLGRRKCRAEPPNSAQAEETRKFRAYLEADWKRWMEEYPEVATLVGYPGQNDRWIDDSPAGIERRKKHLAESLAELKADSSRRVAGQRTTQLRPCIRNCSRRRDRGIAVWRRSAAVPFCGAAQFVDADQPDGGHSARGRGHAGEHAAPQRRGVRNHSGAHEGAASVGGSADRSAARRIEAGLHAAEDHDARRAEADRRFDSGRSDGERAAAAVHGISDRDFPMPTDRG